MIDEKNLADQVQRGIFIANAGNRLDGELAFMRAKAPFGNYAPKTRQEEEAEDAEFWATTSVRYEQPGACRRIWNMLIWGILGGAVAGWLILAMAGLFSLIHDLHAAPYVFTATVVCSAIYGLGKSTKIYETIR